ncbi:MAG: hypothetical protein ACOYI2_06385 [Bacillota bacterium]|jgi:hypothetical protein|nr:hypothetical protein [Clostridia bacterium]
MGKVIYCADRFRPEGKKINQVHTGRILEWDSEGFPAGYLYLELEQPHFI